MVSFVKKCMTAIKNPYLGGSGSKGYRQVKFNIENKGYNILYKIIVGQ